MVRVGTLMLVIGLFTRTKEAGHQEGKPHKYIKVIDFFTLEKTHVDVV